MRHYKVKHVESLARGLQVIQVLQEAGAASLHELHVATGLPKSTLTRILYTAYRQGVVWQRMADGAFLPSYTLQPRARLDDASWLVELASPALEQLTEHVQWPSVLSVPRLDYMEVIETNSPRADFDDVPVGPIHFRANILRSASGRAYLAFCPDQERQAVIRRLRERDTPGHRLAHDPAALRQIIETTRRRGYSVRDPDFGSDYDRPRREVDDGRNSIAMPIRAGEQVLGSVNLTWRRSVLSVDQVVARHLADLQGAVRDIEQRVQESGVLTA